MDAFLADQLHDCIIIINRARGESLRTGLVIICVFRMLVLSELGPWGCPDRDWGVPCTLGPTPATPLDRVHNVCVEAKKEALARRILQVRQLLTPPGTCLIDNATILNAMCDALLP